MFFVPSDKDFYKQNLIHIIHQQIKKQKKEMNKKDYQKPTMTVVKLEHQSHILVTNEGVQAERRGYGTASGDYEQEWD